MFCKNCGQKNEDGVAFCSNCGTKLEASSVPTPHIPTPNIPKPPVPGVPGAAKVTGIISLVCGISSLVLCLCYGSGSIFGIIGLILGIIARVSASKAGAKSKTADLGFTLSMLGVAIPLVCAIIVALLYLFGFGYVFSELGMQFPY